MGSPRLESARAKVVNRDQLLRARQELREQGRTLVQCHGCFDIVHPGHIRHLRQARSLGDVLLVSITGDVGVGKGHGRPLIPQELRAENLAALDCVDLVHVDTSPTALELLSRVRPDVYVKGKEYESNNDPRFAAERRAVEAAGGRVVFSSGDVVFSSTALIAALEHAADPYHGRLRELLSRPHLSALAMTELVEAMQGKRVVVVGEAIIDTYILCDRPEVAGESPVMTLRPVEARHYDGGAAIVARHAAALGARPTLVTAMPRSTQAAELRGRLEAEGVEVVALDIETQLPEKQRFLVGTQKVMKVDLVERFMPDAGQQEELLHTAVRACGRGADVAIVTDFGLGLLSPTLLTRLTYALRPGASILAGDVSGRRSALRAMRGMDLLCPSEPELREAMQAHDEGLPNVACRLMDETGARTMLVTLGSEGVLALSRRSGESAEVNPSGYAQRLSSEHVPALAPVPLDPLGCGDALLATAALALASGADVLGAAVLGSCAAGIQVQRLGNVPVSSADLRRAIEQMHGARLAYAPESVRRKPAAMAVAS